MECLLLSLLLFVYCLSVIFCLFLLLVLLVVMVVMVVCFLSFLTFLAFFTNATQSHPFPRPVATSLQRWLRRFSGTHLATFHETKALPEVKNGGPGFGKPFKQEGQQVRFLGRAMFCPHKMTAHLNLDVHYATSMNTSELDL